MGWKASLFPRFSQFSDKNLDFDEKAANTLEYKHLLAQLIQQNCPEIMPKTFYIDDHNWISVLNTILEEEKQQHFKAPWILKPSLLNNGQGIHIFQTSDAIEAHYLSSQRYGGPHVLQQYINNPHLLRGHKYSIRLFVIISSHQGAFLYPNGYFNIARSVYQQNRFDSLSPHITNEHLVSHEANVIQIPTKEFGFFNEIYPKLKQIVRQVFYALERQHPEVFRRPLDDSLSLMSRGRKIISQTQKISHFAIFGFDFLMNESLHAWILEANHGPCFPISDDHPLQKHLYRTFWHDFVKQFILTAKNQSEILRFEALK